MTGAVELHASDRALKEVVFHGGGGEARVQQIRSRMAPLVTEIVARARPRLRADVQVTDLIMMQFMVAGLSDFGAPAGVELWRRALAVVLDGLRTDGPLPGRALSEDEFPRAVAAQRRM